MPVALTPKGTGEPDQSVSTYAATHPALIEVYQRYAVDVKMSVTLEAGKTNLIALDVPQLFREKFITIKKVYFSLDKNVLIDLWFGVYNDVTHAFYPVGSAMGYGNVEISYPIGIKETLVDPNEYWAFYFVAYESGSYTLRLYLAGMIEELGSLETYAMQR